MTRVYRFLAAASLGLAAVLFAAPAQAIAPSPHNLRLSKGTISTVTADWQSVSGATAYQVYKNGGYAASSTDTHEHISGLACGTRYYVQVKAKVGGTWSPLSTGSGSKYYSTPACTTPAPPPAPAPAPNAPGTDAAAVNLNWGTPIAAGSDEFNYTGAPDPAKWNNYAAPGHHKNGRRVPAQSTVNGSELVQTGLPNGDTGYISSKFRPGTKYGKWETRMKTNARDTEYHPVLLLWPDTGGNTTTEAEIDYAEGTGDPSRIGFYLHYGAAGTTTVTKASRSLDPTVFHNYAVDWAPGYVRGYVDGVLWFEDKDPAHIPNMAMHQGIQVDWFPDGTVTTESKMLVDWTRAYR